MFPVIDPSGFLVHLDRTGILSGLGFAFAAAGFAFALGVGNEIVPRTGAGAFFAGGCFAGAFFCPPGLPKIDKVGRLLADGAEMDVVPADAAGFALGLEGADPKREKDGLGAGAGVGAGSTLGFGAGLGAPKNEKAGAGAFLATDSGFGAGAGVGVLGAPPKNEKAGAGAFLATGAGSGAGAGAFGAGFGGPKNEKAGARAFLATGSGFGAGAGALGALPKNEKAGAGAFFSIGSGLGVGDGIAFFGEVFGAGGKRENDGLFFETCSLFATGAAGLGSGAFFASPPPNSGKLGVFLTGAFFATCSGLGLGASFLGAVFGMGGKRENDGLFSLGASFFATGGAGAGLGAGLGAGFGSPPPNNGKLGAFLTGAFFAGLLSSLLGRKEDRSG